MAKDTKRAIRRKTDNIMAKDTKRATRSRKWKKDRQYNGKRYQKGNQKP
jgi:hypothetical protein